MKRALRITGIIFMGILLLGLILAVVVRVPYFQQEITLKVTGWLEKKIGTKVSVGYTKFAPFHHLVLSDVYLEDQRGDTLLYVDEISAGFDFLPLLQGELRFSSARLSDFDMQLRRESADSPLNIQYIIDAFRSEPNEASSIDLIIDDIELENGRFSYTVVADENSKPLKFENIFAHIQLPRVLGATVEASTG
ncbi:hypothetical protein AGMMS4957_10530 [Bacteroidia bacterium]|nr:hypothetical protein AGMMS4957_10530 [Bacteroidia bacterium]